MPRLRSFVLVSFDILGFVFALGFSAILSRFISEVWKDGDYAALPGGDTQQLVTLFAVLGVAGLIYFAQRGHYTLKAPWWQQVKQVIVFCLFALLLEGFVNYLLKTPITRLWVTLSWLAAIPGVLVLRWVSRALLIRTGLWNIPTILIGGWRNAIETAYALKSETYLRYDLKYAVLPVDTGTFADMHPDILVKKNLESDLRRDDYIVICPDDGDQALLKDYISNVHLSCARYAIVPPLEGFSLYGLRPQYFFGYNIALLEPCPQLQTLTGRISKLLMDKVGAAVALLLLSPLFIVIALKVKKDGGPAFYGHKRLGRNGKQFKCWKFRSMDINSEAILKHILETDPAARAEWEKDFKLKNDPRITKIGHFIRKTSLDEIPQLFNVLKGEMSLVGPRPVVEDEKKYYAEKISDYYAVKPGITGLWQVSGRNDITYAQRVYLDSWYVHHWSLWNDIVIILKTVLVILCRKGAY